MLSSCVVKRWFWLYFSNLCQAVWPFIRSIHSLVVCSICTAFITGSTRSFIFYFFCIFFSVHCTLCIFVFYNHCCLVRINKWMDGWIATMAVCSAVSTQYTNVTYTQPVSIERQKWIICQWKKFQWRANITRFVVSQLLQIRIWLRKRISLLSSGHRGDEGDNWRNVRRRRHSSHRSFQLPTTHDRSGTQLSLEAWNGGFHGPPNTVSTLMTHCHTSSRNAARRVVPSGHHIEPSLQLMYAYTTDDD